MWTLYTIDQLRIICQEVYLEQMSIQVVMIYEVVKWRKIYKQVFVL